MSRTVPAPTPTGRPQPPRHWITTPWGFGLLIFVAIYAWSLIEIEVDPLMFFTGFPAMFGLIHRMWPPAWGYIPEMLVPLGQTAQMALLGTTFGAILAVPTVLMAAKNVNSNRPLFWAARSVMNFIRTLPDILLAALFVPILGVGPVAGMAALTLFSFGIICKLTSESIEAIDPGPLEALDAVGSGKLAQIAFAVVPQVLPQFVSYVLYVLEINIRVAGVLGMVGAGGIGMWLSTSMKLFQYHKAASIILLFFVSVMIIDYTSRKLRERLV